MRKIFLLPLLCISPLMSSADGTQEENKVISEAFLDSRSHSANQSADVGARERESATKLLATMQKIDDLESAYLYSLELFNQLQEWDKLCVAVDAYAEKHGTSKKELDAADEIEAHINLVNAETARLVKSEFCDHPLSDALKLNAYYSLHHPKSCFEQNRHRAALIAAANLEYGFYGSLKRLTDKDGVRSQPSLRAKQIQHLTESYAIFIDKTRQLGLPRQKRRAAGSSQSAIRMSIIDIINNVEQIEKAQWYGSTELKQVCQFALQIINEQIGE